MAMKLALINRPGHGGPFLALADGYHGRSLASMGLGWPHPNHAASIRLRRRSPAAAGERVNLVGSPFPRCGRGRRVYPVAPRSGRPATPRRFARPFPVAVGRRPANSRPVGNVNVLMVKKSRLPAIQSTPNDQQK